MTGAFKLLARWLIKANEEDLRTHQAIMRLLAGVNAVSLLDAGCAQSDKTLAYSELLGIPPAKIKGIEPQARYRLLAQEKFETKKKHETSACAWKLESIGDTCLD